MNDRASSRRDRVFFPVLFVLLWSSGYIGSKLGVPYAEPYTFISLRYSLVLLILLPVTLLMRAPWPRSLREAAHIAIAGLLIQAVYLGGCVYALRLGLPAGLLSLLVSLQPLLTAASAGLLFGERVLPRQWLGLALGFAGTLLVVRNKLGEGVTLLMTVPALGALLGITVGTLWQKRFCPVFDLRSGAVIQYGSSLVVTAALALATESLRIEWSGQFLFALLWVVLALSIGAISLLNYLIRHGSAVHVTSLFYTVPPVTALMAWGIFGETLTGLALAGMALAVTGVALARSR